MELLGYPSIENVHFSYREILIKNMKNLENILLFYSTGTWKISAVDMWADGIVLCSGQVCIYCKFVYNIPSQSKDLPLSPLYKTVL